MKTIKIKVQYCPNGCGNKLDAVTSIYDESSPQEGDFSICSKCHAVLKFGKRWKLNLSSLEKAEKFGIREELEKAIAVSKRVRAQQSIQSSQD